MFIQIFIVLMKFSFPAWSDASPDLLNKICERDLKKIESCCLEGRCMEKGSTDYKEFALDRGPHEMRDYRRLCMNWKNEKPAECTQGVQIQQQAIHYKGLPADKEENTSQCKPDTLTRLVTLSTYKSSLVGLSPNESLIALLTEQKKLCEKYLDEVIHKIGTKDSNYICDNSKLQNVQKLKEDSLELILDLINNPQKRKEVDSIPVAKYLNELKNSTCTNIIE